ARPADQLFQRQRIPDVRRLHRTDSAGRHAGRADPPPARAAGGATAQVNVILSAAKNPAREVTPQPFAALSVTKAVSLLISTALGWCRSTETGSARAS